jgi:hypothetical protein
MELLCVHRILSKNLMWLQVWPICACASGEVMQPLLAIAAMFGSFDANRASLGFLSVLQRINMLPWIAMATCH